MLTERVTSDILIIRVDTKRSGESGEKRERRQRAEELGAKAFLIAPCKLNNVKDKHKRQAALTGGPRVKGCNKKQTLLGAKLKMNFIYGIIFIESLILAQDERWRRA